MTVVEDEDNEASATYEPLEEEDPIVQEEECSANEEEDDPLSLFKDFTDLVAESSSAVLGSGKKGKKFDFGAASSR